MKPEMARLLYETTAFVQENEGGVANLRDVEAHFRTERPGRRDRVHNALSRLCSSKHLKRVADGYAFLRAFEPEPPPVETLFPGEKVAGEDVPPSNGKPSSARPVRTGTVKDWVLRMLEGEDGPVSASVIKHRGMNEGASASPDSIGQALCELAHSGCVRRLRRGVYEAVRKNGEHGAEAVVRSEVEKRAFPPSLSVKKSDEIVDDLEDDILYLEGLIAAWRDEKGVAEIRVRELGERIAAYERNLAWRKSQLERRRKQCAGSGS